MKMPALSSGSPAANRKRSVAHFARAAGCFAAIGALLVFLLPRLAAWGSGGGSSTIFNQQPFADPSGYVATYNSAGNIDTSSKNLFFASLGTNGRTCATCHVVSNAMGLSAASAQAIFARNGATNPLFAMVDGANCPTDSPSATSSHSLLLNNGLIRIALTLPATMQFSIQVVHDPYGCALVTDPTTGAQTVSVYRRPLPATNLNFLSAVMFDGRETVASLASPSTFQANLVTDLAHQALDATLGHAQASTPPTPAQLSAIVNFELGLHSAQAYDNSAGWLNARDAQGGPSILSQQNYYPGINDVLGADPTGAAFNSAVFNVFSPWLNLNSGQNNQGQNATTLAREAIAAGEQIFNTFPLSITVVRGLNDNPAITGGGAPVATISGTCSSCHDAPNVGDHSLPLPLDIGTSHSAANETNPQIASALSQLSGPDLPVFEIDGCPDPFNPGQTAPIYTSDPGKALLTGNCVDVNRIKGPILRGLAARAPYFHNGAAATLDDVVNFYNQRFQMNLTSKEKSELVAFLNSL
jgi:cytochrome c peroxidase